MVVRPCISSRCNYYRSIVNCMFRGFSQGTGLFVCLTAPISVVGVVNSPRKIDDVNLINCVGIVKRLNYVSLPKIPVIIEDSI